MSTATAKKTGKTPIKLPSKLSSRTPSKGLSKPFAADGSTVSKYLARDDSTRSKGHGGDGTTGSKNYLDLDFTNSVAQKVSEVDHEESMNERSSVAFESTRNPNEAY